MMKCGIAPGLHSCFSDEGTLSLFSKIILIGVTSCVVAGFIPAFCLIILTQHSKTPLLRLQIIGKAL